MGGEAGNEATRSSLVPRPSPSSVRNARAQFNARVEKRREKAWTNFTRDPRHRRHKCLTRNSVTYSVLAMGTGVAVHFIPYNFYPGGGDSIF